MVIDTARDYIGTPFHHGGRLKGARGGVDCMGLVACMGTDLGYEYKDVPAYSRTPSGFSLVELCALWLDEVDVYDPQPGDIGLFWIDRNTRMPQHACVFTDYKNGIGMIHAWEQGGRLNTPRRRRGIGNTDNLGSVVEHDYSRFWSMRLCRLFHLRGIDPWRP